MRKHKDIVGIIASIGIGIAVVFLLLAFVYHVFISKDEEAAVILAPLSHSEVGLGRDVYRGMELALDIADHKAGDIAVELFTVDMGFAEDPELFDDPKRAGEVSRTFADERLSFVLGPFSSQGTISLTPFINVAGLPQVGYASIYPGLTDPTYMGEYSHESLFPTGRNTYYSIGPNALQLAEATAIFGVQKNLASITLVHDGTPYSESLVGSIQKAVTKRGIAVNSVVKVNSNGTHSAPASKVLANNPDGLVVVMYPHKGLIDTLSNIDAAQYTGAVMLMFGYDALDLDDVPASLDAYAIDPLLPAALAENEKMHAFADKFEQAYGEVPGVFSMRSFEAMQLALQLIEENGTSRDVLTEALRATDKVETMFDTIIFTENGLPTEWMVYLSQYTEDGLTPISSAVIGSD